MARRQDLVYQNCIPFVKGFGKYFLGCFPAFFAVRRFVRATRSSMTSRSVFVKGFRKLSFDCFRSPSCRPERIRCRWCFDRATNSIMASPTARVKGLGKFFSRLLHLFFQGAVQGGDTLLGGDTLHLPSDPAALHQRSAYTSNPVAVHRALLLISAAVVSVAPYSLSLPGRIYSGAAACRRA